nr:Sugar transporter [Hymenolepis microstoma]
MPILPISCFHSDEFECKSKSCNIDENSLLCILEELGVKYSFTDGDCVSIASALSLQLDCPIISSDPLFYIMSCSSSNDIHGKLKFCPISGVQFSRFLLDEERSYFVESHLFNPYESTFLLLSPLSCRVFSVLWDISSIPQLDLPQNFVDMQNVNGKNAVQAAKKVINWLSEVGPINAIKSAFDRIEDKELKVAIFECMTSSIDRIRFDVDGASLIIKDLGLNPIIDLGGFGVKMSSNPSSSLRSPECTLSHWPSRMLKAYRRGFICPFILSGIYYDIGKIFTNNVDFTTSLPSSFIKALPVRFLHYSLLYSFECSIGFNRVQSSVIEIHPIDSNTLEIVSLPLQSLHLSEIKLNREFIYHSFSYSPNRELSDWLNIFSLSLLIWLKQSSNQDSSDESPIILSVALCALANSLNSNERSEDVLKQYQNVSDKARNQYESLVRNESGLPKCQQAQEIIHALTEIQNIYMELLSVGKMLAALNFYHKSTDSLENIDGEFLPCFKIFPSNQVFYWLTKSLYVLPLNQRRLTAIRTWFPQLIIQSESKNISAFVTALTDLNKLLNHLMTAEIKLVKTSQVKAEVPIKNFSEMTKNCVKVRQILESFLPSETSTIPENKVHKYNSSTNKEENGRAARWIRRKVSHENLEYGGSSCPEQLPTKGCSTPKWQSKKNYAAFLRRRVGIE